MRINRWIWWATVILLYLRTGLAADFFRSSEENDRKSSDDLDNFNSTKIEPDKPKTAKELGVKSCESNQDCVHDGVCHRGNDGHGICMCPRSCPAITPKQCGYNYRTPSTCLLMDADYRSKYDVKEPTCYSRKCVCPPQFDDVHVTANQKPLRLNSTLLPTKCDKRDLAVVARAHPSTSVSKGIDVTLFCCINVDPEGFIDVASVFFIQNGTIMREATSHPFAPRNGLARRVHEKYSCWELEIKNAQTSDSGSYMCRVTASASDLDVTDTMQFEVKAPRQIKNLTVNPSERDAIVTWESEGGEDMAIDLRLVRRTDTRGQVVFSKDNLTSPVSIKDLRAATPYTLFVSGNNGQVPFEFTEHFTTKQKRPFPPKEEDVRVLNSGSALSCEVEWKSPAEPNGRITKYFVSVRGAMRKSDGSLTPDDLPAAVEVDKRCANWDGDENTSKHNGINPIDFANEFYSCKFGPLKPNRNYTVTVWAENSAGRSLPAVFHKNCVTNYAQPDMVETPQPLLSNNHSTFSLTFPQPPDDINGPISCYYIAIVPLPANVSLDILPKSEEIVMHSFSKVFTNNLLPSSAEEKRFFAYIAESYVQLPEETTIGDGVRVSDLKACNVQYLSRYSSEDLALRRGLKYTGFLIVRVDKEEELNRKDVRNGADPNIFRNLIDKSVSPTSRTRTASPMSRHLRQLHLSGPAYGYSAYFKPILLDTESSSSGFGIFMKIILPFLLFLAFATGVTMFFVNRKGHMLSTWCPLFTKMTSKDVVERTLLKQTFGAIPVDDLPTEYVVRHRDTDFLFAQEYESLPHFQLDTVASNRKENAIKNRYNDIRAFDDTRVKLKKINGDDYSDYINANFIKSWKEKKLFIAAQAPVDATIGDFWRMVWEQESYLIVMVANLTEKNRQQCAKYWPDEQITRYGDIIVEPASFSFHSDYAIRAFDIAHIGECGPDVIPNGNGVEYANVPIVKGQFANNSRRILQYHFTNWNDYKAPECSTGLLRFMYRLRELPQFNNSPVVIHCSAGVGRTGTFISIDSMLDQCLAEDKANIFEFVCNLRRQRNLMVQSLEQYVFIYKALAEWHMYGDTDEDVRDFEDHYQRLCASNRDRAVSFNQQSSTNGSISPRVAIVSSRESMTTSNGETGLEEEFKKLERNLTTPLSSNFAAKDENLLKNRYEAAVPFDKYRVILPPTIGHADSSYINASHIKGYFFDYIAAQDPVSEGTAFDFWRMIADQNVTTVVMLSDETDWSDVEKYWPIDGSGTECHFGSERNSVNVTCVSEEHHQDFIIRNLSYSMKDNESMPANQEVVQYSYTGWPSDSIVPKSANSLMNLIEMVLQRQSSLMGSQAPIVVHCRNGSSESGIFICISLLWLRQKAEQRIDVFQTVKGLQSHRPMMFTRFEQYSFCYRALADYISKTYR
ncbi:Receptor-type tyrosine-protein phosphatase [Caenorhabditis elegans]|uniref:Receptor-type tyrosine-protein phosphatase n=1 Tax=Caenorhabditis elegans TaxID=6239 RepID=PTPR_CAEEL|nr:Receptor-type tyrosine-protein phosphatase [Caenorhabditis elegans]H2KZM6.1 RecName: Full=Receptor-type tyrosine-protein phosphatase; Flags: Precursor [Caenorhabditis elegans]CCD68957.1 Receptor-type tyrosine-protein phosphatase [Caenorhabditis elegans]|eukprot:NP_001022208.1 Receptor-type tyrosine-protein phosphatase [Caenorhabditis elegans]